MVLFAKTFLTINSVSYPVASQDSSDRQTLMLPFEAGKILIRIRVRRRDRLSSV